MLNKQLLSSLHKILISKGFFQERIELPQVNVVRGGDINQTYRLVSGDQICFLKLNSASEYPGMFQAEARGLELLRSGSKFKIPRVIDWGTLEDNNTAYLLLEFVPKSQPQDIFWEVFGEHLALLHQQTQSYYGLDHDNYIGSLSQSNKEHESWYSFFAEERIEAQFSLAYDKAYFSKSTLKTKDHLLSRLPDLVPLEKPSLLHGDLWSGNYLPAENPVLIDPAVYFGHREMDLAMMSLFGGFPSQVFISYNQHFPLESNWQERLEIHNLYPLLVHTNLFGRSYAVQVESILKKYI